MLVHIATFTGAAMIYFTHPGHCGPGRSSGKVLDGLGSILGVGGVEIFLHSMSRLILGSSTSYKMSTGVFFPRGKGGRV